MGGKNTPNDAGRAVSFSKHKLILFRTSRVLSCAVFHCAGIYTVGQTTGQTRWNLNKYAFTQSNCTKLVRARNIYPNSACTRRRVAANKCIHTCRVKNKIMDVGGLRKKYSNREFKRGGPFESVRGIFENSIELVAKCSR